MPKKKTPTAKPSTTKNQSKTSFVLGLPATMPAKDVVAKGKEAGLKLTDRYVYVIRSKAKAKGGKPAARRGRPPKALAATRGPKAEPTSTGGLATQFLEVAIDLGLSRAEELLVSLRARVKHAIG